MCPTLYIFSNTILDFSFLLAVDVDFTTQSSYNCCSISCIKEVKKNQIYFNEQPARHLCKSLNSRMFIWIYILEYNTIVELTVTITLHWSHVGNIMLAGVFAAYMMSKCEYLSL